MAGERIAAVPINISSASVPSLGEINPVIISPTYAKIELPDLPSVADYKLNFFRKYAPMGDILDLPEKRGTLNKEILNTSHHELQHALVALANGVGVSEISVQREGNSLGRTKFEGLISLGKFKIIAAAGSINPSDNRAGTASGYGHDFYQIAVANLMEGYDSNNTGIYKQLAQLSLTANYSVPLRNKAAEIIAIRGKVSGNEIPLLLEQARFELAMENIKFDDTEEMRDAQERLKKIIEEFVFPENDSQEFYSGIIIGEDENHNITIETVLAGSATENENDKICSYCGTFNNVHSADCRIWDFRSNDDRNKFQENTGRNGSTFIPSRNDPDERIEGLVFNPDQSEMIQ